MNVKLCSILILMWGCTSCACFASEVETVEVSFRQLAPLLSSSTRQQGLFIGFQYGYQEDLVEISVDGVVVFSERISTLPYGGTAGSLEVTDRGTAMDVEVHFPEHLKRYAFEFDSSRGPYVGISWDGDQLLVEQYNIYPVYD